jgi:hypothetical protein
MMRLLWLALFCFAAVDVTFYGQAWCDYEIWKHFGLPLGFFDPIRVPMFYLSLTILLFAGLKSIRFCLRRLS